MGTDCGFDDRRKESQDTMSEHEILDISRPSVGWALIPPGVLELKDLTPLQKLVLGRIIGLSAAHGYCYASNAYLGKGLGVAAGTISNVASALVRMGYVRREIEEDPVSKRVTGRRLYPIFGEWISLHREMDTPPSRNGREVEVEVGVEIGTSKEGSFDDFWQHFLALKRGIGRVKALRCWETTLKGRLGKKGHPPIEPIVLIEAARRYRLECEEEKTEPQYVMHPATFLGPDRHWEDFPGQPEELVYDEAAHQLWDAVLAEMESEISYSSFETWLGETRGLALQNGYLKVAVPDPFTKGGIERRYLTVIEEFATKCRGEPTKIMIEVRGGR